MINARSTTNAFMFFESMTHSALSCISLKISTLAGLFRWSNYTELSLYLFFCTTTLKLFLLNYLFISPKMGPSEYFSPGHFSLNPPLVEGKCRNDIQSCLYRKGTTSGADVQSIYPKLQRHRGRDSPARQNFLG